MAILMTMTAILVTIF